AAIWQKNFESIRKGGRFISCGVTSGYKAELHLGQLFTRQVTLFGSFMGSKGEMFEVVRLINQGKLKGVVDRAFALEDARLAHEAMEGRNLFGKLVLAIP
ncbi:MAG: NADPH:quinone reductase-related Zn-dependent oxidoreductase, partial [Dehalococcoidia bacterium]|nr:NADPH:quinone reductase-related Zn-dependent oxidoreductase [Dehalococcoidia bacterium]